MTKHDGVRWFLLSMSMVIALGGTACGLGAPGTDGTSHHDGVIRTIVRLSPDGGQQVTTETVSLADYEQEVAVRQAIIEGGVTTEGVARNALTTQDTGCGSASLRIFDNPGNVPGPAPFNHEICFVDSDPTRESLADISFDLDNFDRMCMEWWTFNPTRLHSQCTKWATGGLTKSATSWVKSFWAGKDNGTFWPAGPGDCPYSGWFQPYQRFDAIPSQCPATMGVLPFTR